MGKRPLILVLDDSKCQLELVRLALQGAGYEVVTTRCMWISGEIAERQPALVLIDVNLASGQRPGPEIVKALRGMPMILGRTKLYLYSSEAEEKLQELADDCEADGWIRKKSRPGAELVAAVRNALE